MKDVKRTIMVIMLVVCVAFLSSGISFAGINKLWETGLSGNVNDIYVSDLNQDGTVETIVGTDTGVEVFSENGLSLWNKVTPSKTFRVCAADFNGDGVKEIVAGTDSGDLGKIYAYDINGNQLWSFQTGAKGPQGYWPDNKLVVKVIVAGDVDGDGKEEIVTGSNHHKWFPCRICVLGEGGNLEGDYWHPGGCSWRNMPRGIQISDVENDGDLEIAIGFINNDYNDGAVVLFNGNDIHGEAPSNANGFNYNLGSQIWYWRTGINVTGRPTSIFDINNDGYKEIVAGEYDGYIFTLDHNGELIWSHEEEGVIFSSILVKDIDNDDYGEIIGGTTDGRVYCFNYDGSIRWNYTTSIINTDPPIVGAYIPFVGEIDNDNFYEIVLVSDKIYVLSYDGILKYDYPKAGNVRVDPQTKMILSGEGNTLTSLSINSIPCLNTYYRDADGDGYGDPNVVLIDCNMSTGYEVNGDDCNDSDSNIHPTAIEYIDGKDNDCDGQVDEPNDLTNGLLAYYPFNGDANDESGNINHGTVYGATLTEDRFGNPNSAYSFDGVNDYINNGDNEILKMTNGLSFSVWIKLFSFPYYYPKYQNIISDHAPVEIAEGEGKILRLKNNIVEFLVGGRYGWGTGKYVTYTFDNTILGVWQHIVGTYDRDTIKLFLNGTEVASKKYSDPIAVNSNPVLIGKSGYKEFFQGIIDDIRIYNRALSESEIRELYLPSDTCYLDADGDGYGDPNYAIQGSTIPAEYVENMDDCDDNDAAVYPGAPGTHECKDNNCNGVIDPGEECSDPNSPVFRVLNVQANPGQTQVVVPIEIENAEGIAGVDIILSYDPDILTAQEVRPGPIIDGFITLSNINRNEGMINLGIANSTGIPPDSDSGILAEIIFDVTESVSVGTLSPIVFEEALVYNEDAESIEVISINGEFRIICDKTIYYRDFDGDGFGIIEDSRCLDMPDEAEGYTALIVGDLNDNDPDVYPRTFRVPNFQGCPGQTQVKVPIEVKDAYGITGVDIVLSYDPDILTAQEIIPGTIINGFFTEYYVDQDEGTVNFVIANSTGISQDTGILAEIIFDVVDTSVVGDISPLVLEQALVYNENANLCGAITTNGEFRIEGYKGDLNKDKSISSADAIIILQIAVGLRTPDEYQLWAGDVNEDGWINSADAILVLKAVVKMPTIFNVRPKSGQSDDTITIIGRNFGDTQDDSLALFGDILAEPISWSDHEIITTVPLDAQPGLVNIFVDTVGGSSNTCRFEVIQEQMSRYKSYYPLFDTIETPKILSIPFDTVAAPCEQVIIPIEIDDAAGIAGMDLILGFDPAVLSPVDAALTPLTDGNSLSGGFLLMMRDNGEGRLMVYLANSVGITEGNGGLVDLIFEVSPAAQEPDSTGLIIQTVRLYDENAETMGEYVYIENAEIIEGITTIGGQFTVRGEGSCPSPEGPYDRFDPLIYYPPYYPWLVSPLFPQGDLWWGGFSPVSNYYLESYDYQYNAQNLNGWTGWINPASNYSLDKYSGGCRDIYQWPAYYWLQNHCSPELWANPAMLYLYGHYAPWSK